MHIKYECVKGEEVEKVFSGSRVRHNLLMKPNLAKSDWANCYYTVQATGDIKQAICQRPTSLYSQTSPIVQANGDIKQPNKSGNYTSTTKIHKS